MTVASLAKYLNEAPRIVAFTGAGVSTESGIPDFRSPGGVWTRYDPREFTFDRYVDSADVRKNSWKMRQEFLAAMPQPNFTHHFLADLERLGRLRGVITQNIDGLHKAAGSHKVVEIHGNVREVHCIGLFPRHGMPDGCGFVSDHDWVMEQIAAGDWDPDCPKCGGIVKTATVSFGQAMPEYAMEQAYELVENCDLLLVIGSSLEVYPAAGLPEVAKAAGARVIIINRDPTELDWLADLVLNGEAGAVLSQVPTTHN